MLYTFNFSELDKILNRLEAYYEKTDREFHDVLSSGGMDYSAYPICIGMPELELAFREGMAGDADDPSEEFDIILLYDIADTAYESVIEIYANASPEEIIGMIAAEKDIGSEDQAKLKCVIDTEDDRVLERYLRVRRS